MRSTAQASVPQARQEPAGLVQICGLALILAGCSFVLFLVLHPYGELAGAQAPLSVRWLPAHTFHFLGALFALFGLLGLGARQREAAGRLGVVAFAVAFTGTAPRLAIDATYAILAIGHVLLGWATLRARVLPRDGAIAVMVGVLLFSAPVAPLGPAPWFLRIIGAFVFGGGLARLGYALWSAHGQVDLVT